MLNNLRNAVICPPERRALIRRLGANQLVRAGSGDRRSVVQLRRVRSDAATIFSPGGGHRAATRLPLRHIITF